MKRILLLFVISVLAFNAWATSIVVSTQGTALVYQVNDRQELRQLYWGESLSDPSLYASMQMTNSMDITFLPNLLTFFILIFLH